MKNLLAIISFHFKIGLVLIVETDNFCKPYDVCYLVEPLFDETKSKVPTNPLGTHLVQIILLDFGIGFLGFCPGEEN